MFANASQQVDLAVFGRIAKKLAEDLDVPRENLRDSFTSEELQQRQDSAVYDSQDKRQSRL